MPGSSAALSGRSPRAWALRRTRRSARLAELREAGLVAPSQRRSGTGEFGSCEYRLNVPADVLSRQRRTSPSGSSETVQSCRVPPKPPVAAKASAEIGQQLVLLPSV